MSQALQEAKKAFEDNEVPVGAVIVHNNKIIGRGFNQTKRLNDATAHAEMIALTSASNYLSSGALQDCELYVTLEPCIMCAGAAVLSKLKIIYYALHDSKFGACSSLYNIPNDNRLTHNIQTYYGIYEKESKALMQQFFYNKRQEKKLIKMKE